MRRLTSANSTTARAAAAGAKATLDVAPTLVGCIVCARWTPLADSVPMSTHVRLCDTCIAALNQPVIDEINSLLGITDKH